jgi:hypothetical protein
MNSVNKGINSANKISLTIVVCSVVIGLVLLVTAFIQVRVNQAPQIQWEYLSFSYSQSDTYDTSAPRYELVLINEPYSGIFEQVLYQGCSSGSGLLSCVGKNFQGLEYFLNVLGKDGWEAINFANSSDQNTYRLEMLFKRPIR